MGAAANIDRATGCNNSYERGDTRGPTIDRPRGCDSYDMGAAANIDRPQAAIIRMSVATRGGRPLTGHAVAAQPKCECISGCYVSFHRLA